MAVSTTIHCQIPMATLLGDGVFHVFNLEDWQVDFHRASWLSMASPQCICPEPRDLSDHDDTDEEVNTELLSFSNLLSSKGEGNRVGAAHRSHCLWPQSQPHCVAQPQSWCDIWPVCIGCSTHLSMLGSLSSGGCPSWL